MDEMPSERETGNTLLLRSSVNLNMLNENLMIRGQVIWTYFSSGTNLWRMEKWGRPHAMWHHWLLKKDQAEWIQNRISGMAECAKNMERPLCVSKILHLSCTIHIISIKILSYVNRFDRSARSFIPPSPLWYCMVKCNKENIIKHGECG